MTFAYDDIADLHVHSNYSDGLHSPQELAKMAADSKIRVIALTDHASVSGIAEATIAAAKLGVYVIPGVEINSTNTDFLGYYIDFQNKRLTTFLHEVNAMRDQRMIKIVKRLHVLGYQISWSEIICFSHPAHPSRTHLARMLVQKGYFQSVQLVFEKLLSREKPAYVEPDAPSEEECIRVIQEAGGLVVVAHPHFQKNLSETNIPQFCKRLAGLGVVGYEKIPILPNYSTIGNTWKKSANKYGLIKLGGSNFHGKNISGNPLGSTTIGCHEIREIERLLPDNCLHQSLLKRMAWRFTNLNNTEFRESLFPKTIIIKNLVCQHLLNWSFPNTKPLSDFHEMPYILLGPGSFHRQNEIITILKKNNCQIVSDFTRNDYPNVAWIIYNLDQYEPKKKPGELLRFSLDHYLYGNLATKCRIIYFQNNSRIPLRHLKRQIRSAMGPMKFYQVKCNELADIFFTSHVHMPDEENVKIECWKLHLLGCNKTLE